MDASVVVKWFANEKYSDDANRLKKAYVEGLIDLSAPCILPFEVINALKYTYSLGELELIEISKVIEDFQITYYSLYHLLPDLITLSLKYGITIYDASYVALGKILNEEVYTADEKLLRKVKDMKFVKHITDFNLP
nr:type II toxin-antitoxin system VapC family toxin [Sulfolobus sp. A20]